jgi:hypothetical protein
VYCSVICLLSSVGLLFDLGAKGRSHLKYLAKKRS